MRTKTKKNKGITKHIIKKQKTKKNKATPKHNIKKLKTKKTINKIQCSPRNEHEFSCYSSKSLDKIKQLWNTRHPDARISSNNMRNVWEQLKNNMSNVCDSEKCWLKQEFLSNNLDSDLKNYTFAPESPSTWVKNPNEWLTSVDINKIMKQYEKAYPSFAFIGPSPIDFDTMELRDTCVYKKLCKFNLEKYYQDSDITKIGIIFNLDKHNMPGSHWVSLFVDLDKKFVFYFDSNGVRIPKQINALKNRIVKQAADLNIKLKYYTNYDIVHQKKDGQCGMYCLYFIVQLLRENKTPTHFLKNRVTDESMEDYRLKYFNSKVEV